MISEQGRQMLSIEGFIRFFYQVVRDSPDISQLEAYEKTESEYSKHFGKRRYSCYDSFRRIRRRYLNKK